MATTFTVQTAAKKIGHYLYMEGPSYYSRENVVVKTGESIAIGDICEEDTGIKLVAVAANAICIALQSITTAAAGATIVCAVRHSIFNDQTVNYNSLVKADVDAALKALGIVPHAGIAAA